MEDLLSEKEIEGIIIDSKREEYINDKIFHLGKNKTSIILLSHKSGLILVRGNKDTGYEHIFDRHSLFSKNPFWDKNGKLGRPSKFRLEMVPNEYLTIAGHIYNKENFNTESNKFPDKFDLYDGLFTHYDSKEIEYRLLTYKNTGIIHTFFLITRNRPFNPLNILNLRKGMTNVTDIPISGHQDFTFSYFDIKNSERAKVIVKCDLLKKVEVWSIELYDDKGFSIFKKDVKIFDLINEEFSDKINRLEFGDTSWIEKEIKQVYDQMVIKNSP